MRFPLLGLARDLHPLANAHAERTTKKECPTRSTPFSYQDGLLTRGESPLMFPIAFLVGAVFKVTAFSEVFTAE